MEKLTFGQLRSIFNSHNRDCNVKGQFEDKKPLKGIVVFKQGPWFNKEYPEQSRSYAFSSDNSFFIAGLGGNSIFAKCLDEGGEQIRLDFYLKQWEIDYCYIDKN